MYDPKEFGLDTEDIPSWMRPRYRGIDWTLLSTIFLCFVITAPLLVREGLPPSPEAEMLTYRIFEVRENLENGILYPRWAGNFNYGYGSPLFNYIAPFPQYLGGVYSTLTQDSPQVSLKLMLIGAIYIIGISTMSFARRRWGDLAGIVAATILLFSPYVLQLGPYLKTDLAGLWALALFSSTLWALDRTLMLGRGRDLILVAFISAGLLLADTSLSPALFILAVGWGLITSIFHPKSHWILMSLGLVLGIALSAFYSLPAYAERDLIQWQALPIYPEAINTSKLFDPIPKVDSVVFNPVPNPYLGVSTWLLGLAGSLWLVVAVWRNHAQLGPFLFFVPVSIGLAVALLSPDAGIWKNDFESLTPDDLLGTLTFCCAILGAQLVTAIEMHLHHVARRFVAIGFIGLIVATSAFNAFYIPDFIDKEAQVDTTSYLNLEVRAQAFGTFRNGLFLPKDVETIPAPSRSLSDLNEKIERQGLSPNTSVSIVKQNATHYEFVIESRVQQEITVLTFDYPGWEATRNGQSIDIQTLEPSGLMRVPLRAGVNEIELHFRNTSIRNISWIISILALIMSCGLGFWLERNKSDISLLPLNPLIVQAKRQRQLLSGSIALALATVTVIARISPTNITSQSSDTNIPDGVTIMEQLVQGGLSFLGYEIEFDQGKTIFLTTYWHGTSFGLLQPWSTYQINIQLLQAGQVVRQQTYRYLTNWPSKRWPPQGYVIGSYAIEAPDKAGQYEIALEIGTCDEPTLTPCDSISPRDIYSLQGPIGKQIILPEKITIE